MEFLRIFVTGIFLASWVLSVGGEEMKAFPSCHFPAVYTFGDSNSDTGGILAAFYPIVLPYGETFFHRAVGRASDGRLLIDFIAEHLGLPYLSAYLDSIGASFRHGANFATGGSTIRRPNETVFQSGLSPFSLDVQTAHHDQFKARTSYLYRQAKKHSYKPLLPRPKDFSKALYIFDIGQNDLASGLKKMSKEQLRASIPDMVKQLAAAIQNLYQQGARTFWIHNTGPIGCLPLTLAYLQNPKPGSLDQHGCIKAQNDMAVEFNRQLKDRVIKLRAALPDAALAYVDIYAAKYGLISNAKNQGFNDPGKICCGHYENGIRVFCAKKANINGTEIYGAPCENPALFVSWDGVHYTEAANKWIANHILNGSLSDPPLPITLACHKLEHV
ncbi:hypothetical protein L1049_002340 [Liquidambar formosana]|uniref:GDSL esterase/lipase At5g14450-like n=1 Tax=Liquidambar formosana TaxID=63359 RepID=A0AAP0NFU5_LIQFO